MIAAAAIIAAAIILFAVVLDVGIDHIGKRLDRIADALEGKGKP